MKGINCPVEYFGFERLWKVLRKYLSIIVEINGMYHKYPRMFGLVQVNCLWRDSQTSSKSFSTRRWDRPFNYTIMDQILNQNHPQCSKSKFATEHFICRELRAEKITMFSQTFYRRSKPKCSTKHFHDPLRVETTKVINQFKLY